MGTCLGDPVSAPPQHLLTCPVLQILFVVMLRGLPACPGVLFPSAADSLRGDAQAAHLRARGSSSLVPKLPAPALRTCLLSHPHQGKSQSVAMRSCVCLSWLSLELTFGPGSTPGPCPGPQALGWGVRGCWPSASALKPGGRLESWIALRRLLHLDERGQGDIGQRVQGCEVP